MCGKIKRQGLDLETVGRLKSAAGAADPRCRFSAYGGGEGKDEEEKR